jgi:hypothetical protein
MGDGFTEAMTKATAMWDNLSEDQKTPYLKMAQKDEER